jgi:carbonic anhydrase/acetyltransferase-like protein (isoleucine patch superfamily)
MKLENGNNASIITYKGITPKIPDSSFLCEGVRIIGDVELGEYSSVWYNSVIRGDVHYIRIGEGTNIQDLSMLHVTNNKYSLNIGNYVTVGHSVTLHGCTIKDRSLIGIGATVLDNAIVNSNSLVGAGALVKEGQNVPEGVLVAGVPAKIIRDLTDEELKWVSTNADNYVKYTKEYREQLKN